MQQAIAKGRNEASQLFKAGNLAGTIAILDELIRNYPDSPEVKQDREAAATELVRQQHEAHERALNVLAKRRDEAAILFKANNFAGAISILDRLLEQYPDSSDVQKDRDATAIELARQQREAEARARREIEENARREAEERARRKREKVIGKQRNDAAVLLKEGNLAGAISILDRLLDSIRTAPMSKRTAMLLRSNSHGSNARQTPAREGKSRGTPGVRPKNAPAGSNERRRSTEGDRRRTKRGGCVVPNRRRPRRDHSSR